MKFALAALALFLFLSTGTLAQPKLAIDSMMINLGDIYSGQVKTTTIVLHNIGTQPLKILHVQPTCGCTTVRQPKSELQPHESDEVEVSFNSALYRGPIEKYVNIETNDPLSQYVTVKLIGEVKAELDPVSSSLSVWMGNLTVGKKVEQPYEMRNVSGKTISILNVTSTSPTVTAAWDQKKVGPNDTLRIRLTALPEKNGYDTSTLNIQTDSKNQPSIEVKVYYIGQK
jgi:Protein of unknown function (DUF1573)